MIVRSSAEGVREATIARALGVDVRTWRSMKRRDERVAAALQAGKLVEEERLFGSLFQAAMEGHRPSAMFLLKTRHGYREQGAFEGREPGVTVNIHLPGAVGPEQYGRLIDGEAVIVDEEGAVGPDHPLYDG